MVCRLTVDWGIGLERLTMQLIGEENVRETCLLPARYEPSGTVNKKSK